MKSFHSLPITLLPLFSILIHPVHSWGSLGHRTVSYLASLSLTPSAQDLVSTLLHSQDISEASLFPDKVAHIPQFAYSKPWHYIDAHDDPPNHCGLNVTRDCGAEDGCVVSAIVNHTARVLDFQQGLEVWERGQSLRFLLHFFGDIHQPLHTEAMGRGGNEIPVYFLGHPTNLHSVWDSLMPNRHARGGWKDEKVAAMAWARSLDRMHQQSGILADEDKCRNDIAACALEYAQEANDWVCRYVLKDGRDAVEYEELGEEYYDGAVDIVDLMVGKAGRRLGRWLNLLAEVLDSKGQLRVQG